MKHDSNRHFLYPVARPLSDDYPEGTIDTKLETEHTHDSVQIALTYQVDDTSIFQQVQDSKARCVAMLYCKDTLYRQSIQASTNTPFAVTTSVPIRLLRNQVQVHPVIVAQQDIQQLPLETVHQEYVGRSFSVTKGKPLAFATPLRFNVNPTKMKIQGIFNLKTDTENLYKNDEFEVHIDLTKRYIDIIAGEETMSLFHQLRSNRNITFPSVYMSSLITVLALIKEYTDNNEEISDHYPSDGWFWIICRKMDELGISLSEDSDKEKLSLMMAAQRLLTGHGNLLPFRRLLWQQGGNSDD